MFANGSKSKELKWKIGKPSWKTCNLQVWEDLGEEDVHTHRRAVQGFHLIRYSHQKIFPTENDENIHKNVQGAPCEFATYLNYCRSLRFEEKPDYRCSLNEKNLSGFISTSYTTICSHWFPYLLFSSTLIHLFLCNYLPYLFHIFTIIFANIG